MKKIQKVFSLILAMAMVLSMGVVGAFAADDFVPSEDGSYSSNMVYAYNYYTPSNFSMCNGVISSEADVTIDGDWATLRVYVCNPTPKWGGAEIGVLSDAFITFEDVQYFSTTISVGLTDANPTLKLYSQVAAFFGIEAGESYASDILEFVIPTAALASSLDFSADINLVTNGAQSLWLDIKWVENSDEEPQVDADSTIETFSVPVSASVAVNPSTYSVAIPETIEIGELSTESLTYVDVEIDVTINAGNDGLIVLIDTDQWHSLSNGTDTIRFESYLGRLSSAYHVYSTTTVYENLYFYADDVAGKSAGDYTGTMTFDISSKLA
ncbi:MAG: hypothetical protein R3Y27_07815 [Clostridia bacterium]